MTELLQDNAGLVFALIALVCLGSAVTLEYVVWRRVYRRTSELLNVDQYREEAAIRLATLQGTAHKGVKSRRVVQIDQRRRQLGAAAQAGDSRKVH